MIYSFLIKMGMTIGFGTGSLYKHIEPSSIEAVELIKKCGCNAIELCGVKKDRLDKSSKENFFNISKSNLNGFSHVSFHAPDDFVYDNNKETFEILDLIAELHTKLSLNLIVFHGDIIRDFSVFDKYDFPIAFENMDCRKISMRFPQDFSELMKNPKFGIALDLTHAYTNDSNGELAFEFIKLYKNKIREIHCSGNFAHGEDNQQHFPAYLEEKYIKNENLPNKTILSGIILDKPIIIESVFPVGNSSLNEFLGKELEFIRGKIKFNQIKKEVESIFSSARSSHDFDHTQRVVALALHIGKIEGADLEIIELAALLHDIAREEQDKSNGLICHAELGSKMAREILSKYNYPINKIDSICHCIERHRFRKGGEPESKEAKILYDADKLDSLGAVGLGRAFQFSGEHGSRLHNPEIDINKDLDYTKEDSCWREFNVKLIKIKDKLFTDEARRIAQEREKFMIEFFDRLDKEIKGEM